MSFMSQIITRLSYLGDICYELYLDCYYAGWPLELLDSWFYALAGRFWSLAVDFVNFKDWVNDVQVRIQNVLDWSTIWSYILSYVPNLIEIRNWFESWWGHVYQVVEDWWLSTRWEVQGWISSAQSLLQTQLNSLDSWVANIQAFIDELELDFPDVSAILAWFTNWTGNVVTVVNTWWSGALLEVQGLINTAFIERQSWWAGWSDFRDQVAAFFSDPLEYIWSRFTDWFLGPEG